MKYQFGAVAIEITIGSLTELLKETGDRMARGDGFALATLNVDHLVKLRQSERFLEAYAAQDIVVADGNPIVWLNRLSRQPVDLLPGSELVLPLARQAAELGVPVALLGATAPVLEAAAAALQGEVPGLKVAAQIAPPMGYDPDGPAAAEDLARIAASGAGLCFLALGAPKQECLAHRGRSVAPGVGFASIGAGLDFLAGSQTRAPAWVRAIAMEWAWRMLTSPRRLFRRYLSCALILPGYVVEARRQAAQSS